MARTCSVPPEPDPPRDYLAEARQIAAGRSILIAEPAHVKAALALAAQQAVNVQQLSELLAAFMRDVGLTEGIVPNAAVLAIRQQHVQLFVEALRDGVRVHVFTPPQAATATTVVG